MYLHIVAGRGAFSRPGPRLGWGIFACASPARVGALGSRPRCAGGIFVLRLGGAFVCGVRR